MPRLDQRLKAVAVEIRSGVHADIGSDHGHLLKALLAAGRIRRGIAIENKSQPFANSRSTLVGLQAEVRFADGLNGLMPGEADSISLCGMGGRSVAEILDAHPDRVPPLVVVQPNRQPERVRAWGLRRGYRLVDERLTPGKRAFVVLRFQKVDAASGATGPTIIDPAYERLDAESALLFGPHLIRRWQSDFVAGLHKEQRYLTRLAGRNESSVGRLRAINRLLSEAR